MKQVSIPDHQMPMNGQEAPRVIGHSVRASIKIALGLSLALTGCATFGAGVGKTPQQRASESYSKGDYAEALALYQSLNPQSLSEEERGRLKEVEIAVDAMVAFYVDEAQKFISNRLIKINNYKEANRYLKLALALLPNNHPNRKAIEERLAKIGGEQKEFEKQYAEAYAEVDKILALPKISLESIEQLYGLFYRMQILRGALQKEDMSLYDKARAAADRLMGLGDIVGAYELSKIARQVDLSRGEVVRTTQITDEDIKSFTRLKIDYEKEMARRRAEVERLTQEAIVAVKEKKGSVVQQLIDEVRKLETRDFRAVNQLISTINRLNRTGRRSYVARPVPAAVATQGNGSSVPSVQELGDLEDVRRTLDNLISQFNTGDKFEAIAGLEEAMAEFSDSLNLGLLKKQREAWDADRKKMITEIQKKADNLYIDDDPDALGAYQSLLRLSPSDEAKKKALERIEKLKGIMGK
jgi:hypothetical protein